MVSIEQLRELATRTTKTLQKDGKSLMETTKGGEGSFNMTAMVTSCHESPIGASGKKGPLRFNLHIMSVSVSDPELLSVKIPIDKSSGDDAEITNGDRLFLSCFQTPPVDSLTFGATVQLCGVVCTAVANNEEDDRRREAPEHLAGLVFSTTSASSSNLSIPCDIS